MNGLFLAVVAVAILLRFAGLGDKSLWFDEAFTLHVASRPLRDILNLLRSVDTHPPLYYILLSAWIRLFGTGETALRSLGAIISTGTVAGTWWLGRRLGGPVVGALAAFLTAVSPFQVQAAQEARMYPLLGLLTLSSWVTLRAALSGGRPAWVAYVVTTVLMLYTHYFAFFNIVGQGLFVAVAAPRARQPWLVSQLAVMVLYAPWLSAFFQALFEARGWPFFRPPVALDTVTATLGMLSFGGYAFGFQGYFLDQSSPAWFQCLILVPFLALLVVGLSAHRGRALALWSLLGYLVVPATVAFLISLRFNIVYPRYFSFLQPAFAIVLASGIVGVCAVVESQSRRAAILASVLVLLTLQAWVLDEYYANPRLARFNWRGAAGLVSAGAGPNDVIVVMPSYAYLAFRYYFRGRQHVELMTPRELLHAGRQRLVVDPGADPGHREIFRTLAARHEVMWLVLTGPDAAPAQERFLKAVSGLYVARSSADRWGILVQRWVRLPAWSSVR
jgi:mannosyltransferase